MKFLYERGDTVRRRKDDDERFMVLFVRKNGLTVLNLKTGETFFMGKNQVWPTIKTLDKAKYLSPGELK